MRFRYAGSCLAVLGELLFATCLLAAESYEVRIERDVTAKMRDLVILRADIYRPKSDGRFPVLLQRTPYNKNKATDFGLMAAARGYVVVIQDVRGRYMSDGDWYTFRNESNDGYDTVEWVAALPYSNGKVGMFGESYVGAPNGSRRSPIRRTSLASAPGSPQATTTMDGPTRPARLNNGSTNLGLRFWLKTRCIAPP